MFRSVITCCLRLLVISGLLTSLPVSQAFAVMPVKSANDQRSYESFELPNHLRVLLISDRQADKAAASLEVHAGSMDDPDERPGLAHFLEHMLFLGTKKYPSANAYKDFISSHAGRDNAYTSGQYTNYHFDIAPDALPQALDRFAQFFIAPTFDPAYVERERKAVDAEYRLKIQDDARRLNQVIKATSNPAHPYSRFSVGSLETLADQPGESVRDAMLRFYDDHYSANLMTLAVLGREDLTELRRMVETSFSAIADHQLQYRQASVPLFTKDQRPLQIDIVPIKQLRILRLDFSFPWQESDYLAKPALIFAHLLGHEGEGSLLAWLKSQGWANALNAGQGQLFGREAGFSITVDLTESGLAHRQEIIAQIFATIRLIAKQGLVDWVIDELRTINDLGFRFQEKGQALAGVISLASGLQHFEARQVLRGPYAIDGLTIARLQTLREHLRPRQVRILVMAPGLETDRQEPWYKTPYRSHPLAEERLQDWREAELDSDIHLPAVNIFLPQHVALKPPTEITGRPVLLRQLAAYQLWHEQDQEFSVPKANLFVSLSGAATLMTLRDSVLNRLYVDLVSDALDSYAYPASLAGLSYTLNSAAARIGIHVGGYDDKLPLLASRVATTLKTLVVDEARFAVIHERLRRAWLNQRHDRPYQQAGRDLMALLDYQKWPLSERLQVLESLTADDVRDYISRFWKRLRLRILVHGNFTAVESRQLGQRLQGLLLQGTEVAEPLPRRVVKLPAGREYLLRKQLDHDDSVLAFYLQAGADGLREQAAIALFNQLVRTPFFNQLRTEQQLGYIVNASPLPLARVAGELFIIQSPRFPVAILTQRVESFLQGFEQYLVSLSDDDFARQRAALLTRLEEKDTRLSQRSYRYAHDLQLGYLTFDHRQRLLAAVRAEDKAGLVDFVHQLLAPAQGRRLLVQGLGKQRNEEPATRLHLRPRRLLISNFGLFRQAQESYQLPLAKESDGLSQKPLPAL